MNVTNWGLSLLSALLLWVPSTQALELFEVGPGMLDELPGGKEGDGIIGDFIMRNETIVAVISGNLPLRKANMGTMWSGITPGCLYDLGFRNESNDQLTIFAPSNQIGHITYGRIVSDGSDGAAVFEVVVSAANNGGLYKRHEYRMEEGWQGILITTTLRNEGEEAYPMNTTDYWKSLSDIINVGDITTGDSIDPADTLGYAFSWVKVDGGVIPEKEIELQPGEEMTYARFLAVGNSPVEAYGEVAAYKGETGTFRATIVDSGNVGISSSRVKVSIGDETIHAYPHEDGMMEFQLTPGSYDVVVEDMGRTSVEQTLVVSVGETTQMNVTLSDPSAITFAITDESGKSIPCKAQFLGVEGTENPDLGPNNRAHGCLEQFHSESGDFTVQVPPGSYEVIVTRGTEFSHHSEIVRLAEGENKTVTATLKRLLDTTGWVSTDFHNHSTPSGDNTTGTYDRVINLAAEHIEFAPTTEHNRLYDWTPYIEDLGLSEELSTIPGIELTGSGTHFNSFPFEPDPGLQDGGAPVWNRDPRITAITLMNHQGFMPERYVQANHPDMSYNFIDRDQDGRADGGYYGLQDLIHAAETWGPRTTDGNILTRAPFYIQRLPGREQVRYHRQFIWLQLLNMGHQYWCVSVSDAHTVHGNGVGGWRTYVPSSTDEPSEIDWEEIVRNSKAGQMVISNGPFLEVTTEDGAISGGYTRAMADIDVHVKVQCTDWVDIDRIQFLINSRQVESLNFTRESHPDMFSDGVVKFDEIINVPLSEDSHIIVVAYGENFTLAKGYGTSWQKDMNPVAYNNPIYVDIGEPGFTFNGDTLGFPLPTANIEPDEVKAMLVAAGIEE